MQDTEQLKITRGQLDDEREWSGKLRTDLRDAMTERARLVAFLAACYEAVRVPDWDDDEGGYVLIDTPAGQISFWVAAGDIDELMPHVPLAAASAHDGHPAEEDGRRLAVMTERLVRAGGFAGLVVAMAQPKAAQ
jgi:hypothetical protein